MASLMKEMEGGVLTLVLLLPLILTSEAETRSWHKVQVPDGELDGGSLHKMETRSRLQCAAVAILTQEADLFCAPLPGQCDIYNLDIAAHHDSLPSGSGLDCWTRHECTEGDLDVDDNCNVIECHQGLLWLYEGTWAPNITFSKLEAKNCIYLHDSKMNWENARKQCQLEGGDLFIAGDFQGMVEYIEDKKPPGGQGITWVGAYKGMWLDGRGVTDEEWDEGQPNRSGSEDCEGTWYHGKPLHDISCSWPGSFLCHRMKYVVGI